MTGIKAMGAIKAAAPPAAVQPANADLARQILEATGRWPNRRLSSRAGGALLAAASAADGKELGIYRLDVMPTFDGLAAARGKLYLSTVDGKILCLGGGEGRRLDAVAGLKHSARSPTADRIQAKN
jgi:hypothetical protein